VCAAGPGSDGHRRAPAPLQPPRVAFRAGGRQGHGVRGRRVPWRDDLPLHVPLPAALAADAHSQRALRRRTEDLPVQHRLPRGDLVRTQAAAPACPATLFETTPALWCLCVWHQRALASAWSLSYTCIWLCLLDEESAWSRRALFPQRKWCWLKTSDKHKYTGELAADAKSLDMFTLPWPRSWT